MLRRDYPIGEWTLFLQLPIITREGHAEDIRPERSVFMDGIYFMQVAAMQKLAAAEALSQTVYLFGATGFGKTELVRRYMAERTYLRISCGELPWGADTLPIPAERTTEKQIIVLDDLHLLRDEQRRREILSLIKRTDIWLILVSRSGVPAWLMPSYVCGGFIVISEDDLRLSEVEIAGFLDARGISYTPAELRYLRKTTEGNAYIMSHTALALQQGKRTGPTLYKEIWNAFSDYLENNVLISWESDLLDFLMQVCIVEEFSLELAEMISGNSRSLELLERAKEAGNFLTEENGIYHLRPVLIQALRNRAEKICGTERVREYAYNAGLYYEMHDEIVPALKMFEKSGRKNRIRELLIRNARRNPGNGHYYELRQYYLGLEEAEIENSAVLLAGMSMLCSMLMDEEKSEYWYGRLKVYAEKARGGEKWEALSRLAYLDIGLPHRGSLDMVRLMKRIPAMLFDKGISLPELSVTSNLPSTMNGGKDFCHWSPYDRQLAATIGPLVEQILGSYGKGLIKAALGESLYEKGGDVFEVLSMLSRAQMETEHCGRPEIAFAAVGLRVRLTLLCGDTNGAKEILSDFEAAAEKKAQQLLPNIEALRCRIALRTGDMRSVERWMEAAPNEDGEFITMERYRYLTKVRCYISDGSYLRALSLLERLRYYAERYGRTYIRMETGILLAIVKERMGEEWQEDFLAALREAESYGFQRIISEEGAAAQPLLQKLKKECDTEFQKEWLCGVLAETAAMARRYPRYLLRQTAEAKDFCEAALNILRLQADGLKTPQIAEVLDIKLDTVKYHIKENYRKLGVASKADAVLAARGIGLL